MDYKRIKLNTIQRIIENYEQERILAIHFDHYDSLNRIFVLSQPKNLFLTSKYY
jgi:hypothetical protein